MDQLLEHQVPRLIELLASQSWVEVPHAVCPELCAELRAVLEDRYENGSFRAARIGQGSTEIQRADIRSDTIRWIESDDPALGVQHWLDEVESLRCVLK